jgi:hypothetical protein
MLRERYFAPVTISCHCASLDRHQSLQVIIFLKVRINYYPLFYQDQRLRRTDEALCAVEGIEVRDSDPTYKKGFGITFSNY